MILRLPHHQHIWQKWKLKAWGAGQCPGSLMAMCRQQRA